MSGFVRAAAAACWRSAGGAHPVFEGDWSPQTSGVFGQPKKGIYTRAPGEGPPFLAVTRSVLERAAVGTTVLCGTIESGNLNEDANGLGQVSDSAVAAESMAAESMADGFFAV